MEFRPCGVVEGQLREIELDEGVVGGQAASKLERRDGKSLCGERGGRGQCKDAPPDSDRESATSEELEPSLVCCMHIMVRHLG